MMKHLLPLVSVVTLFIYISPVQAQRPGRGRGGPAGVRTNAAALGLNQGDANLQNQQFGNPNARNDNDVNQNNTIENMPTIEQLAQMMITNFDADGSGGLEQDELQAALTALREMMQNRANGQEQGRANQQGIALNAPNQVVGENIQAGLGRNGVNARAANLPARNLRATPRAR